MANPHLISKGSTVDIFIFDHAELPSELLGTYMGELDAAKGSPNQHPQAQEMPEVTEEELTQIFGYFHMLNLLPPESIDESTA